MSISLLCSEKLSRTSLTVDLIALVIHSAVHCLDSWLDDETFLYLVVLLDTFFSRFFIVLWDLALCKTLSTSALLYFLLYLHLSPNQSVVSCLN